MLAVRQKFIDGSATLNIVGAPKQNAHAMGNGYWFVAGEHCHYRWWIVVLKQWSVREF